MHLPPVQGFQHPNRMLGSTSPDLALVFFWLSVLGNFAPVAQ